MARGERPGAPREARLSFGAASQYRARRQTQITNVFLHPSGALEIRFLKPSMRYKSGQWLFAQVPEVSRYQWHPFTISSAPADPYISIHVRQAGDWTRALAARLGCTPALASEVGAATKAADSKRFTIAAAGFVDVSALSRLPALRIDGPFGAPAEDVFRSECAVAVGVDGPV